MNLLSQPSPARRYDELQGGKDNFAVDRRSAARLETALPSIRLAAKELRRCLERQVGYLADAGIRQFLDIGCGLPHAPNVHEIAQAVDPASRIVYVDPDELVGSHARALLTGTPEGASEFVAGDLTDMEAILADPITREVLDFEQPIGVLFLAVLHFVVDHGRARAAVERIRDSLVPGSYVALTHVTFDPLEPARADELTGLARSRDHGPFQARTRRQVTAFLDGFHLVEPGVVSTVQWHPEREPRPEATVAEAVAYAALGRVP